MNESPLERDRLRTMTLDAAEFIRRFLLHVLPSGFHRIRHYGLFAGTVRARNIARARQALAPPKTPPVRRGGRQGRNPFASAPMPLLRRPDDRRRNLRSRALAIADPDQDRHLMTIAELPTAQRRSPSRPTARRSRKAMSSQRPQTLSRPHAHTRSSHPRHRKSSSSSLPPRTMRATRPRSHTCDPSAISKSP